MLQKALLQDPDPVVQGSAGAMAAVGEEAIDGMLEILINPSSTAMQLGLASWGLAFVGARAPEALRKAATSEHAEIRCAAIAALGDQIQALGTIPPESWWKMRSPMPKPTFARKRQPCWANCTAPIGPSPDWNPYSAIHKGRSAKCGPLLMKLQAAGSIASLSQQLEREQADVKACFNSPSTSWIRTADAP